MKNGMTVGGPKRRRTLGREVVAEVEEVVVGTGVRVVVVAWMAPGVVVLLVMVFVASVAVIRGALLGNGRGGTPSGPPAMHRWPPRPASVWPMAMVMQRTMRWPRAKERV